MSSHFLFHSAVSETIPFTAKYAFPTQASRVIQSTVKIPPRTTTQMGSSAAPLTSSAKGRLIQITLPSQGYLNPLESYLRFDLYLTSNSGTVQVAAPRILNSVHSMFRRLRVLYGSMVLEDIQLYNALVRTLTDVAVGERYQTNVGAITEGMGSDAARAALFNPLSRGVAKGASNPGYDGNLTNQTFAAPDAATGSSAHIYVQPSGPVAILTSTALTSSNQVKHTFTISLCSGLLTQQKLIPLKWLANQLTIELELEEPAGFIVTGSTAEVPTTLGVQTQSGTTPYGVTPLTGTPTWPALSTEVVPATYTAVAAVSSNPVSLTADSAAATMANLAYYLDNIYYVANILEFDSTYDAAFYQGMATGGVPIKFASWHTHQHVPFGTNSILTIQERARSVKSAFTILRKRNDLVPSNTGAFLSDPYWTYPGVYSNTPNNTQWTDTANGIDEFQFRIGGRYFPSQPVKCLYGAAEPLTELQKALNVMGDYQLAAPVKPETWWRPRGICVMGIEFESTNGLEMSGINAEELADLALIVKLVSGTGTSSGFDSDMYFTTFVHFDAMIIIRPNNVVELIQ